MGTELGLSFAMFSVKRVAVWRKCRASYCSSEAWCGRRDLNPHGRLSPADFHAVYGFRRPDVGAFGGSRQVCGLDYPFTSSGKSGA